MSPLFPGDVEALSHSQLRAGALHDDGVLPETHAAKLTVEAILLQCRQRFDSVDKRLETLTTLITTLLPPKQKTEGFTLAPGLRNAL